jgi:hypothetical protein
MTYRMIESGELPITSGILEIDSSVNPVVIFMKSGREHVGGESLTITKVSMDNHVVTLFSDVTLINGVDIVIFGYPKYAKVKYGKVSTIVLRSDGVNWYIIREK